MTGNRADFAPGWRALARSSAKRRLAATDEEKRRGKRHGPILTSAPLRALEDAFRPWSHGCGLSRPDLAERLDRPARSRAVVADNEERFRQTISADFGHRSAVGRRGSFSPLVLTGGDELRSRFEGWMRGLYQRKR